MHNSGDTKVMCVPPLCGIPSMAPACHESEGFFQRLPLPGFLIDLLVQFRARSTRQIQDDSFAFFMRYQNLPMSIVIFLDELLTRDLQNRRFYRYQSVRTVFFSSVLEMMHDSNIILPSYHINSICYRRYPIAQPSPKPPNDPGSSRPLPFLSFFLCSLLFYRPFCFRAMPGLGSPHGA